jgi:alanyl-tRNA synthetase
MIRVERLVNEQIQRNSEVSVDRLSYDDAIAKGAMALFGEKYGDEVRVLSMGGDYSVELCGGTHVTRTGDIGFCIVASESGISAGVRRIEALTGERALERVGQTQTLVEELSSRLKSTPRDLLDRVTQLLADNRRLEKETTDLTRRLASGEGRDLASSAQEVNGVQVVAAEVQGDSAGMMQTLDMLRSKLGSAVIVLGQVVDGKVNLVAGVSKDLAEKLPAPELVNEVGAAVGARGGGRPDMARAGGGDEPQKLAAALDRVASWVAERA